MILNVTEDEQVGNITDCWENLLEKTEPYALWGEGDFDLELFRSTMFETWELFLQRIDFDIPNEEYSLPIDLAIILGEIRKYANQIQITGRADGGDIELSAIIADILWHGIVYREEFPRNTPIISSVEVIGTGTYRLMYNMESGELQVEDGKDPEIPEFIYNCADDIFYEADQKEIKPFVVTDITQVWW